MIPNKWMTKIYEAFTLYHNTVYLFGDYNQTNTVESGSQIHYYYDILKTVNQMTGNKKTLKYIEDTSRYGKKTMFENWQCLKIY